MKDPAKEIVKIGQLLTKACVLSKKHLERCTCTKTGRVDALSAIEKAFKEIKKK